MASIDSLTELLVDELKDLYDAEKRLTKALPKMAKKASNEQLRTAIEEHLEETLQQIGRLEEAFEHLGESAKAKPCAGMRGIIEEGEEHIGEDYEDDGLRDAVIIGSAQRVEHYEIAAYGTTIAHAKLLGHDEIVDLLVQTLNEEKAADEKLTEIAEGVVNLDAANGDDDGEEGEEAEAPAAKGGRGRAAAPKRPTAKARGTGAGGGARGGGAKAPSSARGGRKSSGGGRSR
jgi:ferritin-like metal-binding protein YciE